MNQTLCEESYPWFMTLHAGDVLLPHAKKEIEGWLETSPDNSAGYILNTARTQGSAEISKKTPSSPAQAPQVPLLWRTELVLNDPSPGFTAIEKFPFQKYVLTDKMLELSTRYEWTEVVSNSIFRHERKAPAWMKESEEWHALWPLLQATAQGYKQAPLTGCSPLVTIALCTYNDGAYLPWAVRSVMAQTCEAWELVILDDGSTEERTSHYLMRLPPDPRINLIRQKQNSGKAQALNRILNVAKAAWLLELDADDWLSPFALERLLLRADMEQGVALIYADHIEWVERASKQLIYQGVRAAPASMSPSKLLDEAPAVAPRMYDVSVLKQLGGWDHHHVYGGRLYEDIALLMKLSRSHELLHVPEALYHRRLRMSSMTHRHPHQYAIWKNSMKDKISTPEAGNQSSGQNAHE
ncbi:glycosyl transferase family 2 [Paenibacillus solani]|uniref:Glycosyl transferase family 2 n=1 Tax=Paenibacillus solani TaxID=1705565 RepID=A0A0M1P9Q0_9BACL|nr:glycosyl transferase family 2 [Paenibacillus solani]